jgi:hypothetical protein
MLVNDFDQRSTLVLSPNAFAGGRNGWSYFTNSFNAGSKWLVLLTVNTGQVSLDPAQARVYVVGTSRRRLNCVSLFASSLLRTFDMPHWFAIRAVQRSCFPFQKIAGFEPLNFDL